MAKLIINENKELSTIEPEIYGHFQSTSEDVSMREFM